MLAKMSSSRVKGSLVSTRQGNVSIGEARVEMRQQWRKKDDGSESRVAMHLKCLSSSEPAAQGNARIISDNSYYFFFCLRGGVMGLPLLLPL